MPIGDYCQSPVATIRSDETARAAARRMRDEGLGCLAVVTDGHLQGVITDRDVVLETLCHRLDPGAVRVGEIASREAVTIDQRSPVREAVRLIRRHTLRRLPVVDDKGQLVGIVASDDLFSLFAAELNGLAVAVRAQSTGAEAVGSES
mgnify:CR=1 FL=1